MQNKAQPKGDPSDGEEVMVSTPSADGKAVRVTIYDPAPGFTADALVAKLKAAGESTAQVQKSAAAPGGVQPQVVDNNECAHGFARTIDATACPVPIHWANEGFGNPHVRFNDHTGSRWPTNTAVYDWNTANGVNSYYLYNSCPFQAGARCVSVNELDTINGYDGLTSYTYNSGDHSFVDTSVSIQVNDFYGTQAAYGPTPRPSGGPSSSTRWATLWAWGMRRPART